METRKDRINVTPGQGTPPPGEEAQAWKAAWERPMHVDEKSLDPLTAARMTNHNVRGGEQGDSFARDARSEAFHLKQNVGRRERYGRIAVGMAAALGAAFLPAETVIRVVLGVIGLAGLGTGVTRYCPVSQALGIDHSGRKTKTGNAGMPEQTGDMRNQGGRI